MQDPNHETNCWLNIFDRLPTIVLRRGDERKIIAKCSWEEPPLDSRFKSMQQRALEEGWVVTVEDPRTVQGCCCAGVLP